MRPGTALKAAAPALAAALVIGLIGLLGMWLDVPWLFPSLGPTIAIQAANPELPSARPWNVCAGHMIGLACAIAAIFVTGAAGEPSVASAHVLSGPRVAAAVLAVLLSTALQAAARARHPPAEATTLLFALGALQPELRSALAVAGGVALVALLGEPCRRMFARLAVES